MIDQAVNTCGTAAATCTLGAWLIGVALPALVVILSVILLSLNISWFIWLRIKEWRKGK